MRVVKWPVRAEQSGRIKREAVAHSRGISAAPEHPYKKARQQKRIDRREKEIIERPLHAFSVPNGESVAPGSTFLKTGVPQATVAPLPTDIPGAVQLFVPMKTSSPIVV